MEFKHFWRPKTCMWRVGFKYCLKFLLLMEDQYMNELRKVKPLLAEAASKYILPLKGQITADRIITKEDDVSRYTEPVTEADIDASRHLLAGVRTKYPGSFSEEDLRSDFDKYDAFWLFDPLDGTQELIDGIENGTAIHAALLVRGSDGLYHPEAGMIHVIDSGQTIYSTRTQGPYIEIASLEQILAKPSESDKILGVQREVDPNGTLDEFYSFLQNKTGKEVGVKYSGGAGATVAQMLTGQVNLYILNYGYTKEWDTAMAEPILERLGGKITDLAGNPIRYGRHDHFNRNGFVMTLGLDHNMIIEAISEFDNSKPLLVER